jgi:hypothetical protein
VTTPSAPGARAQPLLNNAAQEVIGTAQRFLAPSRPVLTAGDRKAAEELAQAKLACTLCGALHPLPSTPSCPRLATFTVDADGKVTSGTFWPEWDTSRVVFLADAAEDEDGDE